MLRGILIALISSVLMSCASPKPTYRMCSNIGFINDKVGDFCYLDKTATVSAKVVEDFVGKYYANEAAELSGLRRYCEMIRINGDRGLSKEDSIRDAGVEFKSSFCPGAR
ncbi:MAG: hypothetical protein HY805_03945 [Nitrospirae bacterium]|nr:hypothetical protein [Nitrospirota bacterium]